MLRMLLPFVLITSVSVPLMAQSAWHAPAEQTDVAAALTPEQLSDVVLSLAERLESTFYSPEIAAAYAAALRKKLQAGGYSHIADRETLAKTVTADLQAVNKDGHLSLRAGAPGLAPNGRRREDVKAIAKSGWIADGVALLEFRIFNGEEAGLAELARFITDHAEAKTLIIDVRRHYGGGIDEMDVLFSALFEQPTALLQGDTRSTVAERIPGGLDSTPSFYRLEAPAGVVRHEHRAIPPAGGGVMMNTKIYLLVSRDTVSAGEHLALALKRTGRATLIGQATRGAGNFGQPFKLPHSYSAFIPFGRTFDPSTGEGWEGTGVAPDIEVSADAALEKALEMERLQPSELT